MARTATHHIMVANLTEKTTEKALIRLFNRYGDVLWADIFRTEAGSKGMGKSSFCQR